MKDAKHGLRERSRLTWLDIMYKTTMQNHMGFLSVELGPVIPLFSRHPTNSPLDYSVTATQSNLTTLYLILLITVFSGLYILRCITYLLHQDQRKINEMEIPVIDFNELNGEARSKTMALLHQACEKWGFFQVENHGIDKKLMDKVKQLINEYYEENLRASFYKSEIAKSLDQEVTSKVDWESSFFIWHRPTSNIEGIPNFSEDHCKTMNVYIAQLIKMAEKLSELMCENLGLEKGHIKDAFSGGKGPSVGTKVAKYPQCPQPELVRGLREHTDAGGIILLLQDDQVPGLEFLKDGEWFAIPPSKNNTMFVNIGDQVEVLSNGRYKSVLHRVLADKNGSRLSIATFYNPAGDAIISPAPKLLYPNHLRFQDYLKHYATTKFSDKGLRFETMKQMANNHNGFLS